MDKKSLTIAKKASSNILNKWNCSPDEISVILACTDESELLTKISFILNIHAQLRTIFSNPENVYGFMKLNNQHPIFNGSAPLELVLKDGCEGLKSTFHYLSSFDNPSY